MSLSLLVRACAHHYSSSAHLRTPSLSPSPSLKVFTPPAPKTVIQRAIDKGILTPFEAVDFTTSSNMKIHKPKKYKHNYLKPTYASEARSQQLKERNELEVWMSGGR